MHSEIVINRFSIFWINTSKGKPIHSKPIKKFKKLNWDHVFNGVARGTQETSPEMWKLVTKMMLVPQALFLGRTFPKLVNNQFFYELLLQIFKIVSEIYQQFEHFAHSWEKLTQDIKYTRKLLKCIILAYFTKNLTSNALCWNCIVNQYVELESTSSSFVLFHQNLITSILSYLGISLGILTLLFIDTFCLRAHNNSLASLATIPLSAFSILYYFFIISHLGTSLSLISLVPVDCAFVSA